MGFLPVVRTTRSCGGHSRTDGRRCAGCIGPECYTRQRTRALVQKYGKIMDQGNLILDNVKSDVKDDEAFQRIIAALKSLEQEMNAFLASTYAQVTDHARETGKTWQDARAQFAVPAKLPSVHAIA